MSPRRTDRYVRAEDIAMREQADRARSEREEKYRRIVRALTLDPQLTNSEVYERFRVSNGLINRARAEAKAALARSAEAATGAAKAQAREVADG